MTYDIPNSEKKLQMKRKLVLMTECGVLMIFICMRYLHILYRSEVLYQSGYLDQKYMDQFGEDDFLKRMRYNTKRTVNRFRIGTERQLRRAQSDVRRFFSSDFQGHDVNNLGSGFAAGAVAGFMF